jgi:hypothetical protein
MDYKIKRNSKSSRSSKSYNDDDSPVATTTPAVAPVKTTTKPQTAADLASLFEGFSQIVPSLWPMIAYGQRCKLVKIAESRAKGYDGGGIFEGCYNKKDTGALMFKFKTINGFTRHIPAADIKEIWLAEDMIAKQANIVLQDQIDEMQKVIVKLTATVKDLKSDVKKLKTK